MTDEPFDFNAELDKLMSGGHLSEPATGECLISREPLGETRISLECGHAFNYVPLLNEVVKQKCGHRATEVVKLHLNQVKCPYCRNIQNRVLPYCPSLEPRRMAGVNAPAKWEMLNDKCTHVGASRRSKNFGTPCSDPCWGTFCKRHQRAHDRRAAQQATQQAAQQAAQPDGPVCGAVLKSGSRKGGACGRSVFDGGMCKRHFNLLNKQ
jgi:hypothetical protein